MCVTVCVRAREHNALPAHGVGGQAIHKAPLERRKVRVVEIVGGDDAIEASWWGTMHKHVLSRTEPYASIDLSGDSHALKEGNSCSNCTHGP